ncbi:MAG TPA: TIGR03857 family LLM class F420-dependent oxidoreductase [Candidatus Binatia bacterium]|jgi:probable F420-dependent oxidoreductase|nr:TIGR03857 family LLM class F420-dependent oxidoreductase [Candidatus Binatia bacterium]
MAIRFPELGFYTLPGRVADPRPLLDEVRDGERAGFGSTWISERHDVKEAATLSGAAGAVTSELAIAVGVTNPNTRHVMLTAAIGSTMSALTGGRFALGLGRGFDMRSDIWGIPRVTGAMLGDTAQLLRRLWAGEKVMGHDGPAGQFPYLSLDHVVETPPPLLLAALGPRTQRLAGRAFDAVLLHSHWTDAAVAACASRVRQGAEQAGRDPSAVQIWSCLVTACDLPEPVELRHVVRRMTTYMQIPGYGELIVDANGWDRGVLERLRGHELLAGRLADATEFTLDELRQLRDLYPPEWLTSSNAIGSPAHCAQRMLDQFAAGAAGIVIHASSPQEMQALLAAYDAVRPAARFANRSPVPGR